MGLTAQNIAKHGNFWYKFATKGYIPLSDFFKILSGEGAPGLHPHAKFCHCSFKSVALWSQKSPKIVIFGKKLPPGKILGVDRKT